LSLNWPVCDNILLIGAGFSKNFGGLLASEMWSEVFNHPDVRRFPQLVRQLDESWPDYETVYERVVLAAQDSAEASALHRGVLDAYDKHDRKLRDPEGPIGWIDCDRLGEMLQAFAPSRGSGMVGFVFSLNQDLFPERHAWGRLHFGTPTLPGFGALPGRYGPYLEGGDGASLTKADLHRAPTSEEIGHQAERWITQGNLHWIKLHGSQNWRDSAGRDLMVIGGGKDTQIQQEPILRWYWELFKRTLFEARHRLVVIGYSFRDPHVNEAIVHAIQTVGVDLVVVDAIPWGDFRGQRRDGCYWGDLASHIASDAGSRYLSKNLADYFPHSSHDTRGVDWQEFRRLLLSPLSSS